MWYMDNSYGTDVPFGGPTLTRIQFQGHLRMDFDICGLNVALMFLVDSLAARLDMTWGMSCVVHG